MTETRLSFKEMCARFDVTPRTLRYYEYIELLAPEKEGRARFYGPREMARLKLILRGRRFGFSLEEIRQWLLIYGKKGERQQLEHWLTLADRQLVELERQRAELTTILCGRNAGRAVRLMEESGLLHWLLPEIVALKGVEQGREFHPEGDVYTHTLLVLEAVEPPGRSRSSAR